MTVTEFVAGLWPEYLTYTENEPLSLSAVRATGPAPRSPALVEQLALMKGTGPTALPPGRLDYNNLQFDRAIEQFQELSWFDNHQMQYYLWTKLLSAARLASGGLAARVQLSCHHRQAPVQRFAPFSSCLLIMLTVLLVSLAPQASWAISLKSGEGIKAPVSLSGHMSVLRDPSGKLTIDDVAYRGGKFQFKPIPSMLTEGYRKGAVWVRFSLSASGAPDQWLLQIERPLLENVTLYVPDGRGRFTASAPGRIRPGNGDGAGAYPTVFSVLVPSTQTVYYIRFQSATSITTALNLWQSEGYEEYRRFDDWVMGIVIGAIGVMIFTNLLYAAWLKDSLYLVYTTVLLESGLMTLFHMGYAPEVLRYLDPKSIHHSWGIIVCLYSMVMMLFLALLFEFRRHWIWAWRISQGVVLLNGVALVFAVANHYGDVGYFVSRLQQVSIGFVALFVLYLLFIRKQYQYVLPAIAFLGVISVLSVMQMQYTGANPFQLDGSLSRLLAGGTLIHLVLLSAAVAKRTQLAEQSLSAEKDRVIAISRSVERELAIKVRERTAELAERNASLKAEVDRRHLLEVKLRQSLDSVNGALAQQRDFVALVSHEFRGPLAVIDIVAANLARSAEEGAAEIEPRTAKIRRTVRQMAMLIENVLAGDRLHAGHVSSAQVDVFDLNDSLRAVGAGLDDVAARRVRFIFGPEAIVGGDRALLEVALQNLVQNALKYSAVANPVMVRLSTESGVAFVEVMDCGAGVAVDDRELIFTKYYRAGGQQVSGSGLGLYIAREIARQHGGDLILAATGAGGSTFRLSLLVAGSQPDDAGSVPLASREGAEAQGESADRS